MATISLHGTTTATTTATTTTTQYLEIPRDLLGIWEELEKG